jgi:hypothetical protein
MRISMRAWRLWYGLGFALLVALACSGEREGSARGEAVAESIGSAAQAPGAGLDSRLVGELALPADLPSDVPRYPGAALTWAHSDENGILLSFLTPDEPEKVAKQLNEAFTSEGWLSEASHQSGGSTVFAVKGSRNATVLISTEDDGTHVEIVLMPHG